MNKLQYPFGNNILSKNDISMNLVTDGFRYVAFEQNWDMEHSARLISQLSDIENQLSEADCDEFVDGLQDSLHDSEMLYRHVTNFTQKMLKKWQVIDLTSAINRD